LKTRGNLLSESKSPGRDLKGHSEGKAKKFRCAIAATTICKRGWERSPGEELFKKGNRLKKEGELITGGGSILHKKGEKERSERAGANTAGGRRAGKGKKLTPLLKTSARGEKKKQECASRQV